MITEVSPTATVVLDGSGNGQCAVNPPSGTKWALRLATLSTSTAAKHPLGFLYRGSPSGPLQLVDSTFTGDQASSAKVGGAPYFSGQWLWAVWKGGDPGATATLQAFGQQGGRSDPLADSPLGEGFANQIALIAQSLQVGGPAPAGELDVNNSLPALLATAYTPMGTVSTVTIRMLPGDGSYYYMLTGVSTTPNQDFYATGIVPAGATLTTQIMQTEFSFFNSSTGIGQTQLLDPGHDSRLLISANSVDIGNGLAGNTQIDGTLKFPNGGIAVLNSTPGATALSASRTTDTQLAYVMDRVGNMFFGSGTAVQDTAFYRSRATELAASPIVADMSGAAGGNGEVWHAMTLLNGFANRGAGFPAASYRMIPSPARSVEIKGQVTSGGAAGTVMATLPAGYRPLTEQPFWAFNNSSNVALLGVVETTGNIQLFGSALAAGNVCQFTGLISLDL